MKKKKNSFTLIEVLLAIVLTTTACFFLLQFEESYIRQARQSVLKLQQERLMQEALVTTFERLYTNQVDWKLIEDRKVVRFPLSEPEWQVTVSFEPKIQSEKVINNLLDVKVSLQLEHRDQSIGSDAVVRLCLKKEERLNVQPAA